MISVLMATNIKNKQWLNGKIMSNIILKTIYNSQHFKTILQQNQNKQPSA